MRHYSVYVPCCPPADLVSTHQLHCCLALSHAMQNFWQRVQNYLMSFLTPMLQSSIDASQHKFIKQTGHSFRLNETGLSTSAAVIAVVDWALEFPQPMPPRMHVSVLQEPDRSF